MVDFDHHNSSSSSSTIQYQETQNGETAEDVDDQHIQKEGDEDDDTFVRIILLQRELNSSPSSHPYPQNEWIERARLDSIEWIFNTRALFRFQCQTAYLSVAYFDMFLSRRMIDSDKYWAVRLLSVACLILAAKMEECEVPLLTEFSVEDYEFENKVIQRMELLVLNTLEWKMSIVTPFYFLSKFCDQNASTNLVSTATDLVFAFIKNISSMTYRPSVIAAAATLLAMDQKLTRQCVELKINANALFSENLRSEDVFSCYNRMQGLDKERFRLPESILSTNLSPEGADVFRGFSVTSSTSSKRLRFNDYDQNCGK